LWFVITALYLCFWVIGNTITERPKNNNVTVKEIEETINYVNGWIFSLLFGLLTASIATVYYNWLNCAFFVCNKLPSPSWFNGWFSYAFAVMCVFIIGLAFLLSLRMALYRLKDYVNKSKDIECLRCHTIIHDDEGSNYCIKCGEPLQKKRP